MGRPAVLKVDIIADAKGVGAGVDDANGKFGKLGGFAKTAGLAVAGGLAVGAVAAGKFALSAIGAASDAQQAFGAVDQVFGKFADQVKDNAGAAADAVGLSSTAYAEMASIIGSQLRNAGTAQDELAGKTDNLIRLGSDLAATYGGSVSDAVSAVSSLMKGETDPIERYGVSIKASDVSARLAAEGLDHLSGAAAKQAQSTAALELLTEQTTAAHGQFAAQTDTLAEKQQILGAKFDNIKTKIGGALLPAATALFTWFDEKLAPTTTRLANVLAEKAGPAFHAVGHYIQDVVIPAAKGIAEWFGDHVAPLLSGVLSVALHGIRDLFAKVTAAVNEHRDQLETLARIIGKVAGFLLDTLGPAIKFVVGTSFKILGKSIEVIIDTISGLVDALSWVIDKLTWIKDNVGGILGKVGGVLSHIPGLGSAWGVDGMVAPVHIGPSPEFAPGIRGLVTAASPMDPLGFLTMAGGRSGGGLVVVDNRDLSVHVDVDGALDGPGVAEQITRLLDDHQARIGAVPTFGAA